MCTYVKAKHLSTPHHCAHFAPKCFYIIGKMVWMSFQVSIPFEIMVYIMVECNSDTNFLPHYLFNSKTSEMQEWSSYKEQQKNV